MVRQIKLHTFCMTLLYRHWYFECKNSISDLRPFFLMKNYYIYTYRKITAAPKLPKTDCPRRKLHVFHVSWHLKPPSLLNELLISFHLFIENLKCLSNCGSCQITSHHLSNSATSVTDLENFVVSNLFTWRIHQIKIHANTNLKIWKVN